MSAASGSEFKISGDEFKLIVKRTVSEKPKITVSKKVAQKAVDRNRIRRMFKEAIQEINPKVSLVVILKKNLSNLKMQEIKKRLEQKLSKYSWSTS